MQPKIASRVTALLGGDEGSISRRTAIHDSPLKIFALTTSALSTFTTILVPDEAYWPVRSADNHTISTCRWSSHLGVSITRKPMGLSEACPGTVFLHTISYFAILCVGHHGRASETFVEFYKTTRRHNPEDGILLIHRRENS
jgi:hypothetical protein